MKGGLTMKEEELKEIKYRNKLFGLVVAELIWGVAYLFFSFFVFELPFKFVGFTLVLSGAIHLYAVFKKKDKRYETK